MTMHELYKQHGHALGCTGYGEFCKLWPKLDQPAKIGVRQGETEPPVYEWYRPKKSSNAHECIAHCEARHQLDSSLGMRVVLLDGTVIREWHAK